MKVYIVTQGEYSDYHIEKVFKDLKKAAYYCAVQNAEHHATSACDYFRIEEFSCSDDTVEIADSKEVVYFYSDEDDCVPVFGSPYATFYQHNRWDNYSIASPEPLSQEKLKKIVEDLRTKYLAEKEGLT